MSDTVRKQKQSLSEYFLVFESADKVADLNETKPDWFEYEPGMAEQDVDCPTIDFARDLGKRLLRAGHYSPRIYKRINIQIEEVYDKEYNVVTINVSWDEEFVEDVELDQEAEVQ